MYYHCELKSVKFFCNSRGKFSNFLHIKLMIRFLYKLLILFYTNHIRFICYKISITSLSTRVDIFIQRITALCCFVSDACLQIVIEFTVSLVI